MSEVTRDEALREFLSFPCPVCGDKTAAETGCPMKGGSPCVMQEAQAALEAGLQRAAGEEALVEALRPFAQAVEVAGDDTNDMEADAWESSLAMAVKIKDFYNARAALAAVKGTSDV